MVPGRLTKSNQGKYPPDKYDRPLYARIRALLRWEGIDVNHATSDGNTALILAADRGRDRIVGALLAMPRVDVNLARYENGYTALILAAHNGHVKTVRRLVARGARQPSASPAVTTDARVGGCLCGARRWWRVLTWC